MSTEKVNEERMKISFRVKEYSEPLKPFIMVESEGEQFSFMGDKDAFYLVLRNEKDHDKAQEVAKYLRDNIVQVGFLSSR